MPGITNREQGWRSGDCTTLHLHGPGSGHKWVKLVACSITLLQEVFLRVLQILIRLDAGPPTLG